VLGGIVAGCSGGAPRGGSPVAVDAPADAAALPADVRAREPDTTVTSPPPAASPDAAPIDTASAAGAGGGPVSHRFLNGFSDSGMLAIVEKDGTIAWQYSINQNEANDAWLLPSGNVVLAYKRGAREVSPDKQIVWDYPAAADAEIHTVQPLPGDQFLVGESHGDGTSSIYEMDRTKKISHTTTIATPGGGSSHSQFREVRKTPQGTYLISQQRGGGHAMEFDASGKLLRTFPCGRFVGLRLPDGNTLISCGDDHRVIEVDPQDKVVWEIGETEIPGNRLYFAAGLQRLPNGNTVICNWPGHSNDFSQPQVFEVTRDKKVVWELRDKRLGWISNIHILDPEAAVNGVALR
jgi:hypothetical protein